MTSDFTPEKYTSGWNRSRTGATTLRVLVTQNRVDVESRVVGDPLAVIIPSGLHS
jgi:hypothetical protein